MQRAGGTPGFAPRVHASRVRVRRRDERAAAAQAELVLVSSACLLATLLLHRRAVAALRAAAPFSAKRMLYRLITSLAPAIGLVNFLAVTSPPMHQAARSRLLPARGGRDGVLLGAAAAAASPRGARLRGGVDASRVPPIANVCSASGVLLQVRGRLRALLPLSRPPPCCAQPAPRRSGRRRPLSAGSSAGDAVQPAGAAERAADRIAAPRRARLAACALLAPLFETWVEGTLVPGWRRTARARRPWRRRPGWW